MTKDQQLIEDFLRDELSEELRQDFLKRLKSDQDFASLFHGEKQLFDSLNENNWSFIKDIDNKEVKEYQELFESDKTKRLQSVLKDINAKSERKKVFSLRPWILYSSAAVIAILVTAVTMFRSPNTMDDLYADYLDLSSLPSVAERTSGSENILLDAEEAFKKEQYQDALFILNTQLEDDEKSKPLVILYKGISLMELDQFAEAEKTFNQLISSNFVDASKGHWYKALLYLKKGDKEEAIELLSKISSEKYYNFERANQLLEDLD